MGLLLHQMNKNYKILSFADCVVPTYAPENFSLLFRQRSASWDLCSHVGVGYFETCMVHFIVDIMYAIIL